MSFWTQLLGMDAQKAAGKASKAQNAIAKQQLAMMQQASPYYGALLQWAAQRSGLHMPGMQTPGIAGPIQQPGQARTMAQPGFGVAGAERMTGGPGPVPLGGQRVGESMDTLAAMRAMGMQSQGGGRYGMMRALGQGLGGQQGDQSQLWAALKQVRQGAGQPGGQPAAGLTNREIGIYGSNPEDVYRLQQAEEGVNRDANQRAQMLQYRLGQQGIGNSATAGAALAHNEQSALSQLANFRRQLAINAPMEEERRMQAMFQLLGMGQGAGAQASSIYGQNAALQQQQGQGQQQMLMQLLPFLF